MNLTKEQLLKEITEELLATFSAQSEDCRAVRIMTDEEHEAFAVEIEDWGKGASGPHKDPNTTATLRAVRAWFLSRGFDLVNSGDGDGEVGHTEQFEIRKFYPNKNEKIFVSNENCRPVRAYYRGTLLARDRVDAVENCGDYSEWARDAGDTLLARDSDSQYIRAAARAVCALIGVEG